MKTRLFLLVLTVALLPSRAAAEDPVISRYRLPGKASLVWHWVDSGFGRLLTWSEGCGLSREAWVALREKSKLRVIYGELKELAEFDGAIVIEHRGPSPQAHVDAFVHCMFEHGKRTLLAPLEQNAETISQDLTHVLSQITGERARLEAATRSPSALLDRTQALRQAEERIAQFRDGLAEIRIEKAVAEAQSRALRQMVQEYRKTLHEKYLERLRAQYQALMERVGRGHAEARSFGAKLEQASRSGKAPDDDQSTRLTARLMDIEIDLVGYEERAKQIKLAMDAEQLRRGELLRASDLAAVLKNVDALESKRTRLVDEYSSLRQRIIAIRSRTAERTDR